ncbi:MAG: aldo/keto reductase [Anaerolineae bacterium UTCFX2]|nr:aldo/keto reductase [Anaerolineales bacterium]OQY92056.1 MAG: aldo/keto reductase [Anaerolineae bacterium UTCFX2]
MQTNQLGSSNMNITRLGIGTWAIGGLGYQYSWGPQDDRDSVEAIQRALDFGINWIDTASGYGKGHSEEIVAQALKGWSGSKPYVFTKCGLIWDEAGNISPNLTAQSIRQQSEDSLRRLQVEAIDLMQIHWPTDKMTDIDEAWGALARLQQEGKIRWLGVSNFDVGQMQRAQAIAPITSLQPPYSLIRREIEAKILPFCQLEKIGVIVYSPMYCGLLSGAMTRERVQNLPDSDWRKQDVDFVEPNLSKNLDLVERLKEVGAKYGRSAGEAAIAWTLKHPAVTGAIVGVRNARQAEQIMSAGDLQLTKEDVSIIDG